MSDTSSTPPKPKVGSLRDRIAAFEKPASSAAPGPPPAVRPKPAGFATWKPKVPSPPSSPAAASTEHGSSSSVRVGGMSASDAKESITKAGSLKDRMAALQGRGAFGAPPTVAPKPAVDRPRWRPPPVVHAPVDDGDHPAGESSTASIAAVVGRTISPPASVKPQESIVRPEGEETASPPPAAVSGEGEGDSNAEAEPADPEEEERQRRAAIAARMARLGGARLGMAPPVFGKKPPVRRPTQEEVPKPEEPKPVEEEPKRDISSPEAVKPADEPLPALSDENLLISPPANTTVEDTQSDLRTSQEYFPTRKNSENTSILSSESTESHHARSPASMPVPSVPRRAGPPRKKPVKPAAPPPEVPEEEATTTAIAGAEEEVSPPVVDEPKGESTVESLETPRDDLLAEVQELKAAIQQVTEMPSADQPLAVPQPSLSRSPVAEEATPITPRESDSILIDEPSGIRSPPPSRAGTRGEGKESERFEVDDEEDDGEDDNPDTAEALATPPIPVRLSPSREAYVAVTKPKEPTSVSPPIASEEDTTDEAEEEERKKHVAERLAKMGGINPFAVSPPTQTKPQQETSRSPPQMPVSFFPSSPPVPLTAVQDSGSVIHPSPPSPTRKDSTTESNAEEEEEAFDEDDDGEVFDNEPGPIPNKHYESPVRPPVPPPATRPPVKVQQFEPDDDSGSDYGDDDFVNTSASSIPVNPPANLTSPPKLPPARPAQPPRRIVPQAPEENEVEEEEGEEEEDTDEEADERLAQSQLFVPPPTGRTPGAIPPNRRYLHDEEDGNGSESDSPALPILHRKSLDVPAGRPTKLPYASDVNETWDIESDHDGQALPIPPRRTSGPPPPRVVPPPPPPALQHPPPVHRSPPQPPAPAAVAHLLAVSPPHVPRTISSSSEEILGEEEGDPIDPGFHSPSRRASTVNLAAQAQSEAPAPVHSSPSQPAPLPVTPSYRAPAEQEETGEHGQDLEQLRRNTIAERMAKLGGIKFGAAPVPTSPSRPSTRQPSNVEEDQAEEIAGNEEATELSEEEEERARKERIAAKMASMGGMRIGMMPMGMGGFPPQKSHVLKEETVASPPLLSPAARAVPPARPPPPPAQSSQVPDSDSDYGSAAASEDGVKVEAEESSELEEVNYEDAEETEEEPPPPPPVPSRAVRPTRRQSSMDQPTSPHMPPSRPPVPTSVPQRRSSIQTTRSGSTDNAHGTPPQRSSSFMPSSSQSEYVMVEEPESQETPLQPSIRHSRLPPMRSTPQIPQAPTMQQSPEATTESISSQWELPSIPRSSFDFGGADLSLSWTDAGEPASPTTTSQPSAPPPPAPSKRATLPAECQLSADDLIALWGRVGVQVCEIATSMYEKSKKTLIGDGTYPGFVQAVVATVPNAAPVPTASGEYGYVVYLQNGASVQKRASEIMPGDVVEIHDAKFKGHKGLQTYHQNVGAAGEDLVGVVGEFEAKKSKIRVFHANQHVGQQTVESVSYRLEDLKSGIVKVYRVLEA